MAPLMGGVSGCWCVMRIDQPRLLAGVCPVWFDVTWRALVVCLFIALHSRTSSQKFEQWPEKYHKTQ